MTERDFAADVVAALQRAGHTAYFAGGCVRDTLLGLTPADYDVATAATPEQVTKLFRRAHQFGASFGVVEVLGPKGESGEWLKVQVATFRSDGTYSDGRRPDAVTFSSPEEDAARRDFTVNGLFLDPATGEVFDYVGGRADLAAKVLRAIGDPAARFAEDKLRVLRLARMAARFDLRIDPGTAAAATKLAPEVGVVSAERVAEELRKILAHPSRARGVELLLALGVLTTVSLELMSGVLSGRHAVLASLPPVCRPEVALAALLESPADALAVTNRLKMSLGERDSLQYLTRERPLILGAESRRLSELKPVLAHPARGDLLALCRAEVAGRGLNPAGVQRCESLVRDLSQAELDPPPLLTGDDLRAAGYAPGPAFKRALSAVRRAQLDLEVDSAQAAWPVARASLDSGARQ